MPPAMTVTSTISSRATSRRTSPYGSARSGQFFQDASEKSGVDWRLLAAIGYQESKWDPKAASRTARWA